jgi:N4-gp56 family major capsid protein
MPDNIVTIADMKNPNEFFQKVLLRRIKYDSVFEQFALKGKVEGMEFVSWFRVNRLNPGTPTQLGDTNPSPLQITTDKITGQVGWYGAYAKIGRKAKKIDPVKATTEYTEVVGDHGRETREMIMRDSIISGATSVYYAGAVAGRANVSGVFANADLKRIFKGLEKQGAEKITEIVVGAAKDGTRPVEACYIMIVDSDQALDVRALTGFTKCADYSDPSVRFKNEFGACEGFRFISSNFMTGVIVPGAGSTTVAGKISTNTTNCDVYRGIALGKEAFGIADLETMESILKTENEIGGPLNMFATTGYIMAMTSKALNPQWFTIYETAASV